MSCYGPAVVGASLSNHHPQPATKYLTTRAQSDREIRDGREGTRAATKKLRKGSNGTNLIKVQLFSNYSSLRCRIWRSEGILYPNIRNGGQIS